MGTTVAEEVPVTRTVELTEREQHIANHLRTHLGIFLGPPEPGEPRSRFTAEEDRLDLVGRFIAAHAQLEEVEATMWAVWPLFRLLDDFLSQDRFDSAEGIDGDDTATLRAGWDVFVKAVEAVQGVLDSKRYWHLLPVECTAMWDRVRDPAPVEG